MALTLKTGKGTACFLWEDGAMEARWTLRTDDSEEDLLRGMMRIVAFVEAQQGPTPVPVPEPSRALQEVQEGYQAPANGWASIVQPEIPERLQGEVELIPPGEQE